MKDSTIVILVAGVAALLFWAVSTGVIKTVGGPIQVGNTGVVAPQPTSNYSGYLAASTAPGVAGALNSVLSGLSTSVAGWFGGQPSTPKVGQVATPTSPAAFAQPSGPSPQAVQSNLLEQASGTGAFTQPVTYSSYSDTLVGPQVDPAVSYASTAGSAFDFSGLSADNAYDPAYSLQDPLMV